MNPGPPFYVLTQLLNTITGAFTSALFLREPHSENYSLTSYSSSSRHLNPAFTFTEGEGFWGWTVKHGKALNVSPFTPDYKPLGIYLRKENIQSFLAVPLERISGVISVDSLEANAFGNETIDLLANFGIMIESLNHLNDRLAQAENDQRMFRFLLFAEDEIERGGSIDTVLEELRLFIGADQVFWATPIGREETVFSIVGIAGSMKNHAFFEGRFALKEGLIGWVFRNAQPLVLDTTNVDKRKSFLLSPREPSLQSCSFVGMPAIIGQTVHGVVGIVFSENRQLSETEMDTLRLVVKLFGSAAQAA